MESREQKFRESAEAIAFDREKRDIIEHNIGQYDAAVSKGKRNFRSLENAKIQASKVKGFVIRDLEQQLLKFEENATRQGWEIYWASTTEDVLKVVERAIEVEQVKSVVKMKSMVSEELNLNNFLGSKEVEAFETDLGEFIVQMAGEKPYHILTPAMHKSKEDVAKLFAEKFDMPPDSQPEQITAFVREKLRTEFIRADLGITGANFLIADSGAVALTENEGNGLLCMAFPKIHIVIAGIEKLIPTIEDLDLFLPFLAQHGTGQHITVYNNLVFGPKNELEPDGPDQMYVIFLDNRRTELLKFREQRKALSCIRCGACLNGCPIYKSVGGYTYKSTYSGPIGSVISPHYLGMKEYNHLSFASSLCGKCTEVCPVKIPLHELLLHNRHEAVTKKYVTYSWRTIVSAWKTLMLHRWMLDKPSSRMKNRMIRHFGKKMWGTRRTLPKIAPKSFREQLKETHP